MLNSLEDAVVVITGASSGVGQATAEAFARRGSKLVLAARDAAALHEVARTCRELGAEVLVAPTDVTDADAVKDLARKAMSFGKIDVCSAMSASAPSAASRKRRSKRMNRSSAPT